MIANNADNYKFGNLQVDKVYQGDTLIWPQPQITEGWYQIKLLSDTCGDWDITTLVPAVVWGDVLQNHSLDPTTKTWASSGPMYNNYFKARINTPTELYADRDYTNQTGPDYRCHLTWDPATRTWDRTDNIDYWIYSVHQSFSYSHSLGVPTTMPQFLVDVYKHQYNFTGEYPDYPKTGYIYLFDGETLDDVINCVS